MGVVSTIMIAGAAISAGSQIAAGVGARRHARGVEREGERLADDARARGLETESNYRMDLAQLLGTQRTNMAAQGIDTTFGSAAALRAETERFGALDVETIRANTAREARGITANARLQARGLRNQALGQFAEAGGTLLTTGVSAWRSYQQGAALRTEAWNARALASGNVANADVRLGRRP